MIASMLRTFPLASTAYPVSWKTGTSNNNHDAWCFAFTEDYTLGIWFGNKSGKSSADLIGGTAAAPAAGEIFNLLYERKALNQQDWTANNITFRATVKTHFSWGKRMENNSL